jgi:hypothetical protein
MVKQLMVCGWIALLAVSAAAETTLPKDVEQFINKREGCDHFRGEIPDPGQKRRMREVTREIQRLCTGTDIALAQLKKKYANDAVVMQSLEEFEPQIEASNTKHPKKTSGAR